MIPGSNYVIATKFQRALVDLGWYLPLDDILKAVAACQEPDPITKTADPPGYRNTEPPAQEPTDA